MKANPKFPCSFWTTGPGALLRGNAPAQVLAAYLLSCPHGNMLAPFYLIIPVIEFETGLGEWQIRHAFAALCDIGFARYNAEACMVRLTSGPMSGRGKVSR